MDDGGPKDTTKFDLVATNPDGETDEAQDAMHVFRPENDQCPPRGGRPTPPRTLSP